MSNTRLSVMFSTVTVIAAVIYSILFIEKLAFILVIHTNSIQASTVSFCMDRLIWESDVLVKMNVKPNH